MRLAVTGSIATDHLMTFPGRFSDQLIADQLAHVSLSFLVDSLHIRRGGAAANIALGLGRLGLNPLLVAAVGGDFSDYAVWLNGNGVDTQHIRTIPDAYTARFLCTTDAAQNQIASFYPGAMRHARDIDLASVLEAAGPVDLVLIAPDDPEAMLRHTRACRATGTPFAADPSQQLATLDTDRVKGLVNGARYLFTNAYERALLLERTGWPESTVLERVGTWITTLSEGGVRIDRSGHTTLHVPAVPVPHVTDPTGAGDAFRAGFLAATAHGLDAGAAALLGCTMAACALEAVGPQSYRATLPELTARLTQAYGPAATSELRAMLAGTNSAAESHAPEPSPVSRS
ncbi:carbohydrate kinase family protein [Streptomyces sp. So13.3]|uniref:carbohydrate kinase family protein n=1 Tax=unclassified Streptomyces TaxID=2593676 RepID=UPI001106F7BF|nr:MULTISPECIES: carbohydrate kinase family protein [unclassified Streptomyces]MCZ4102296.1 carbohydrate kinase family protein [Streptomyces sp. H39-C1]QNA76379.1 carbohydrate kinase family protein [Streptomyces sp. So13.3]